MAIRAGNARFGRWGWAVLTLGLGVGFLGGCDQITEDQGGGFGPVSGKVCYRDSDCAPNDCCGNGTRVVHIDDAPSCDAVECVNNCPNGTPPTNSIDCGCAIPYCSDEGECVAAASSSPQCS